MILLKIFVLFAPIFSCLQNNYPIPAKNSKQLFYIQRTHNRNTIVYEANFDSNGNLNSDKPVLVYWIMYEEKGQTQELNTLERNFAYGIKHKAIEASPNEYELQLTAYKKLKLYVKQIAPFKAIVFQETPDLPIDHIFVHANNAGLWTKVDYLDLYISQSETKKLLCKKILIK